MSRLIILTAAVLYASSVTAQTPHHKNAHQNQQGPPQQMPVKKLKQDSPVTSMPVVKPDTTKQEAMPVVKPPANIQPK